MSFRNFARTHTNFAHPKFRDLTYKLERAIKHSKNIPPLVLVVWFEKFWTISSGDEIQEMRYSKEQVFFDLSMQFPSHKTRAQSSSRSSAVGAHPMFSTTSLRIWRTSSATTSADTLPRLTLPSPAVCMSLKNQLVTCFFLRVPSQYGSVNSATCGTSCRRSPQVSVFVLMY